MPNNIYLMFYVLIDDKDQPILDRNISYLTGQVVLVCTESGLLFKAKLLFEFYKGAHVNFMCKLCTSCRYNTLILK